MKTKPTSWPDDVLERAGAMLDAFEDIYILTPSHQLVHRKCEILRHANRNRNGKPKWALRLAQLSSSGKTACIEEYIRRAIAQHAGQTGQRNPHLILYVPLRGFTTPKSLCQDICRQLGDENWQIGTLFDLINRMQDFVVRAGVEMIIIDEVQELKGKRTDRQDVTNLLKSILNHGVAPLVLVGDETSEKMFEENIHLGNRAGSTLELRALTDAAGLGEFKGFCLALEQEMHRLGMVRAGSVLSQGPGQAKLVKWSGGHIGRVCRIIAQALEHSVLRHAVTIEMADLDYAIEHFAIPNNYRVH